MIASSYPTFLPAISAEEDRAKSDVGIVRIEALAIERYPSRRRRSHGRVDMSGAREEAVQLERHERPVARPTALVSRSAHKDQHRLKLVAAARFGPARLRSKAPRSLDYRDRFTPRQLLSVFETDFQLDPDREWMRAQRTGLRHRPAGVRIRLDVAATMRRHACKQSVAQYRHRSRRKVARIT
jgi:hypothetical protein